MMRSPSYLIFASVLLAGVPSVRAFNSLSLAPLNDRVIAPTSTTELNYINDSDHYLESLAILSPKKKKKPMDDESQTTTTLPLLPLSELKAGDEISGRVVRLLPYGALVQQTKYDIPGKTPGCVLLHKDRCDNFSELKLNQEVSNARVSVINRAKNAVTISTLAAKEEPRMPLGALQELDEVEGRVKRVKGYGAFVDIGTKRDALLHSSQTKNLRSSLRVGDVVTVQVLNPWRSYDKRNRGIAVRLV